MAVKDFRQDTFFCGPKQSLKEYRSERAILAAWILEDMPPTAVTL
jgi:hypothetical protein